jgi:hypothetical protein
VPRIPGAITTKQKRARKAPAHSPAASERRSMNYRPLRATGIEDGNVSPGGRQAGL